MKIFDERNYYDTIPFEYIAIGDVFEFKNHIYIKINCNSNEDNAFNLSTDSLYCLEQYTLVTPVNATLTIEERRN